MAGSGRRCQRRPDRLTMNDYQVNKLPADRAGSGWYELLPVPPPAETLQQAIHADWVIIGAGFAGLAAARQLAQRVGSERIVVLDAQRVGWGSAGRNSGFMIDLPHELNSTHYAGTLEHDHRQIRRNRAAIEFAREAVEEFGLQAYFSLSGKTHGAVNSSGETTLSAFCQHLDALEEPYSWLDGDAMRELTGSAYYRVGIHTPGAAIIQPAAYIRGLAAGLTRQYPTLNLYENSPVLRIETVNDGVCQRHYLVHTREGQVAATNVILTVNGYAEAFGLYTQRLMHVYTFASMTRELSAQEQRTLGGVAAWALIPADPMGSTVRRIREGRIVVRSIFTYNPEMQTSEQQIAAAGRRHERSFRARFPMLTDVDMQYRWGGQLCLSLNSSPGFGEIEPGLYAAVCQNGLGTVQGTLVGMLIAEYATHSNNPMIHELLNFDPPQKLYPQPLMTLAAKSHLWWRQQRAGRDL